MVLRICIESPILFCGRDLSPTAREAQQKIAAGRERQNAIDRAIRNERIGSTIRATDKWGQYDREKAGQGKK